MEPWVMRMRCEPTGLVGRESSHSLRSVPCHGRAYFEAEIVLPATLSTSSGSLLGHLEMDADRTDVGRRSTDDRALGIRIVGDHVGRLLGHLHPQRPLHCAALSRRRLGVGTTLHRLLKCRPHRAELGSSCCSGVLLLQLLLLLRLPNLLRQLLNLWQGGWVRGVGGRER